MPGALVRVHPLGVMTMTDGGVSDDKIIAVTASAIDPAYDGMVRIADLPADIRRAIPDFAWSYKLRPDGTNPVAVGKFEASSVATCMILETRANYRRSDEAG
jgi:inorganic pyrophosphatase